MSPEFPFKVTRAECEVCDVSMTAAHKWTFCVLIACTWRGEASPKYDFGTTRVNHYKSYILIKYCRTLGKSSAGTHVGWAKFPWATLKKSNEKRTIYITEADKAKLQKLLAEEILKMHDGFSRLEGLTKELMKAKIVESSDVPSDVITMNSKVFLKPLGEGESEEYVLVFPGHANEKMHKVSVLSPIGTAMIGCRVGHVFGVKTLDGERQMMVEQILYQPEAAGDYHL